MIPEKISLIVIGCLVLCAAPLMAQPTATQKYLLSVERIYDRAPHSAFTDLIEHKGSLYCAFREGTGHVPGKEGTNGTIRIIVSRDGQNWQSLAVLTEAGVDLRDPKLSVTPDGRLMVVMGGSFYEGERLIAYQSRVAFSDRAITRFDVPRPVQLDAKIKTERDWLWRVTWHGGSGYGVVYQQDGEETKAHLLKTQDGVRYEFVTTFDIAGRPNETTIRVMPDGEMIAWVRRERGSQNGFIGTSRRPYTNWMWRENTVRLGGPNFIALPNGKLLGVTRGHLPERKANTYVAWLTREGGVEPIVALPSGGDTSYAGMLVRGDQVLVAYYSSHEGKTAIYLARLDLKALTQK